MGEKKFQLVRYLDSDETLQLAIEEDCSKDAGIEVIEKEMSVGDLKSLKHSIERRLEEVDGNG